MLGPSHAHTHREDTLHTMDKLCLKKNTRNKLTAEINRGSYRVFCHFQRFLADDRLVNWSFFMHYLKQ